MEDLDGFLALNEHVDAIREKEKSREAVLKMLNLVAEILNYICNFVPSGISGVYCLLHYSIRSLSSLEDAIRREYTERVRDFKNKFTKARLIFNESLQVEILNGVYTLGERCRITL